MITVGLLVRIEAKPDKVDKVEAMLTAALAKVEKEEATTIWLAVRLGLESGLPGSIRTDDRDHLAGIDAKTNVMKCGCVGPGIGVRGIRQPVLVS
jgi:hypothetical protein